MSNETFPLSVIVHTKNSARTLDNCLRSVSFADEIVVLDMESTDDSRKIAKKYTSKVLRVDDYGYVEPVRNFGIKQASYPWILLVDADEEISDGLRVWIESFVSREKRDEQYIAYFLPRKNLIFKQEIQHTGWWPDYQLRFFKKGHVTWSNAIHSVPTIQGQSKQLPSDREKAIIHHNYETVDQYLTRLNHYTTIMASEKKYSEPFSSKSVSSVFGNEFFRRAFEWNGVGDGALGVSLSLLQGFSELVARLKYWEKAGFHEVDSEDRDAVQALETFHKQLGFWIADWHVKHSSGVSQTYWKLKRKKHAK